MPTHQFIGSFVASRPDVVYAIYNDKDEVCGHAHGLTTVRDWLQVRSRLHHHLRDGYGYSVHFVNGRCRVVDVLDAPYRKVSLRATHVAWFVPGAGLTPPASMEH